MAHPRRLLAFAAFALTTLVLFTSNGYAQTATVRGKVVDSVDNLPLPGVNVVVKGTATGTATGMDGDYSLQVPSLQDTLVFSYVGYESREVPIQGRTALDVELDAAVLQGGDVVVVGYGTVERENLTSAVSQVDADDLIQGAATDPAELIRGQVAGLTINKVGSNPAESATLKLRGIGTIQGDARPLVIIDGIEGSLSDVAPQDIASVTVIKDASAAAIYGTRGSNGVVLIETKRAESGVVSLQVDSYMSAQQTTQDLPVLSVDEYRALVDQGVPGATDYGSSTNWADEVLRDLPVSHVTNIMMRSGGTTSYIANLNYQQLQGLMERSNHNALKGRLRVDHAMFDGKLNASANVLVSKEWRFDGAEGGGSFNGRVLRDAFAFNPTRPIFNPDGSYNENADNDSENPVSLLQETTGEYQSETARLFGDIAYSPFQDFTLKVQGSRSAIDGLEGFAMSKAHVWSIQNGYNGYASRRTDRTVESILELTGEYENSVGGHDYAFLGGYTWKENAYEFFYASNYDFPTDAVTYNNLSDGKALTRGQANQDSYKQQTNLLGYFARLNYDFRNRYLLMASFRREASSRFGRNNKWGWFPAVSVGWNIARERFMEPVDFVDNLKLRFGFGIAGSEPTNPYMSLSRLSFGSRVLWNGDWVATIQPMNNPNPNLRWEERKELNLGLDFILQNGLVDGSIDVYRRQTSNLLYPFTVPTPPFLFDTILANAGTIQNEGIEVLLNTTPVRSQNFQWRSTFNYSTNRNQLLSLSNETYSLGRGYFYAGHTGAPIQQNTHRIEVGGPIGNFFGYKTVGVTEDGMWMIEGADGQPKPITDQHPDDRTIIGNGVPDHVVGWTNNLRFKNWDLSMTMRGAFGFQILNLRRMYYGVPTFIKGGNVMTGTFDPVFGERPLSVDQSEQYVSYFIEDGDFWKIDNITLGYRFGVDRISAVKSARIYGSLDNFKTFTGYSGFDPEVNFAGLSPGFDNRDRYPSSRHFTLGASLTF